jgi:hypothetical protein
MCPHIASPILLVVGMQGSAKTTMCRLIRSLVDPSTIPLLGAVEQKDMMQVLHHHALPCLENVGHFSRKEADILCRAVTGDSIERRKLYTDKDSVIFAYRRPIIINGIDIPTDRPDVRDRSLIIRRSRVEGFRPDQDVRAAYEQDCPVILGALLDVLVDVLRALPFGSVGPGSFERMRLAEWTTSP